MLWRVRIQSDRYPGRWRLAYSGNEPGARTCYADLCRRRKRGNVVLIHGDLPVLWAPRPLAVARKVGVPA